MEDELDVIIQNMVSAGESEDNIALVINSYSSEKKKSIPTATPQKLASGTTTGSSGGNGFPKTNINSPIPDFNSMKSVRPVVSKKPIQKPTVKEDDSFYEYLKENLDNGITTVSKSFYDAPGLLYDAAASITNPIIKGITGYKGEGASADKLAKDLGFVNIPSEILKEKLKVSNEKINAYAVKNGGDALKAVQDGNYVNAAKLVAGTTMQSLPIMVAAMASGGQTSALVAIGASTASTKNAQLKEENPEMGLGTRVLNSANAGIIEAVTGHLFTGASGAVMKRIITDKGVEAGSKIIGKSFKSTIEKSIEKNPLVGAVGEVIEESAVEFGNQVNDMSSGIRTEFDFHSIKNAGLSATGMGGLQTLGVYGAKGYVKAKTYAKVKATNKEVFKLRSEIDNGNLSDENKAILSLRADRLEAENKKLLGTEIEKAKALPAETKTELNALNQEFEELKTKFDDIDDADDIPENLKPAMKEEIRLQASKNQKRKTEILSQNDGLEVNDDFSKFNGVEPDFDLENGKISSLPLKEQDRLNDQALQELTGGDMTVNVTNEQVSKKANEIYENEQNPTTPTPEAQPQAEVQKPSEAEKVETPIVKDVVVSKSESTNPSFEDMIDFNVEGGKLELGKINGAKIYSVLHLKVDEDRRKQGIATKLLQRALEETKGELSGQASNDMSVGLNYKLGMRAFDADGKELSLEETKKVRAEKSGTSIRMILPENKRGSNYTQSLPTQEVSPVEDVVAPSIEKPLSSQEENVSMQDDDQKFTKENGNTIVDDKGGAMTVFHGTNQVFDTFDKEKQGSNTGWANTEFGFFFIGDENLAKDFALENGGGENIISANISIKNPVDLTTQGVFTNKKQAPSLVEILTGDIMSEDDALEFLNEEIDLGNYSEFKEGIETQSGKDVFIKNGFDGVISDFGDNNKEYVVFEPEQVKILSQTAKKNEATPETNTPTNGNVQLGASNVGESGNDKPKSNSKSSVPSSVDGGEVKGDAEVDLNLDDVSNFLNEQFGAKKPVEVKETPKPKKEVTPKQDEAEQAKGFVSMAVSNLTTSLKNFQGRAKEYSEQTYNRIVNEAKEGKLNISSIPPIQIWKSPDTGKFVILAGHSRTKAFSDLADGKAEFSDKYKKSDFTNVNAQIVEAETLEEAQKIAKESNQGAVQTIVDNAKYVKESLLPTFQNFNQAKTKLSALYGKSWVKIFALANLNPKGKAMQMLNQFQDALESKSYRDAESIAEWTGKARADFDKLTNAHENEIFEHLLKNDKIKSYSELSILLNNRINGLVEFNENEPLNFEQKVGRGSNEAIIEKEVQELRNRDTQIKKKIKSLQDFGKNINETQRKEIKDLTAESIKINTVDIPNAQKKQKQARVADAEQFDIFSQINEQIDNGNITPEKIDEFVNDDRKAAEIEPIVEAIERKGKSDRKDELKQVVIDVENQIERKPADRGNDRGLQKYSGKPLGQQENKRPGIVVQAESKMPTTKDFLSENYEIDEVQKQGVNSALSLFESGGKSFLLADGTGVGKTRQILVIAKEYLNKFGGKVLIISENTTILEKNFANDAKALGIDMNDFEYGTYNDLRTEKKGKGSYGLVIYDEAHNLKNQESGKAIAAGNIKSTNNMYVTATPMDTIGSAVYFISEVSGVTEEQAYNMLGLNVKKQKDAITGQEVKIVTLQEGVAPADIKRNIVKIREEIISKGAMLRREYPFYGEFVEDKISLTEEQANEQDEIESSWDDRIEYESVSDDGRVNFRKKMNLSGQKSGELSRWSESTKIKYTFAQVVKEIKAGKKVVVIAEGVNETTITAIDKVVPGFLSELSKMLKKEGFKVAEIFGKSDKGEANDLFQANAVDVVLGTAKSASTGIDLDDQNGDSPRVLFMVTPNYSGNVFQQILGRVSRRNTKSPAQIRLLFNESNIDARRKQIVNGKLQTLKAIQEGVIDDEIEIDIQEAPIPSADVKINLEGITLEDISAKAFVVKGDTKPIKDNIKAIGGRYNPKYGWMFPISRKAEVQEMLNKLNDVNNPIVSESQQPKEKSILNSDKDLLGNEKEDAMTPLTYEENPDFNADDVVYIKSDRGVDKFGKRNQYSVRGKDENGKYVLWGKANGSNLNVDFNEIEKGINQKKYPLAGSLDAIDYAMGEKLYSEWVKEGRMSASDAKVIIESAGFNVPSDIEKLATKQKANAEVDRIAQKIKDILPGINDPDLKKQGISQDQLIDLIASAVKNLVSAGIDVNDAIKQVVESIKAKFGDIDIDPKAVEERINPKKEAENNFKSKSGKKSLLGRLIEGGNPDVITKAVKELGENYDVRNQQEANDEAMAFIDKVGVSEALKAIKDGLITNSDVKMLIYDEALTRLKTEISDEIDNNPEDREALIKKFQEVSDDFDNAVRDAGQGIAILNYIYNKNQTLKYNLKKQIADWKRNDPNNEIPADIKAKYEELDQKLKDIEEKTKEAEVRAKKAEDELAIKNIQEDVERKNQDAKKNKSGLTPNEQTRKKVLKNKFFGTLNDVTRFATLIADPEFREYLGLTFKAAKGDFSNFSNQILKEIGNGARKYLPELFKEAGGKGDVKVTDLQSITISEEGKIKIPAQLLRDYVEQGYNDIDEISALIKDDIADEYPDADVKDIRDALTGYGKQINPNKDDITAQVNKLKEYGRLLSAYDDVMNGEMPKKSGLVRPKSEQKARELRRNINRLAKELNLEQVDTEKQWANAIDKVKTQLKNQIEDLDKQIANGEKRKIDRTPIKLDEEASALKTIRDAKKQILDDLVGKPELTEAQKIASAEKSLETYIGKIQDDIYNGEIEYKEKPTPATSKKIEALKKVKQSLLESKKQLRKEAGLIEQQRLKTTKTRVKNQIEDLKTRLANNDFAKKVVTPVLADSELNTLRAEKEAIYEEYEKMKYLQELKNRTFTEKMTDAFLEAGGLTRAIKASLDLGLIGIQLRGFTYSELWRNPKELGRKFVKLFGAIGSQEKTNKATAKIIGHPLHSLSKKLDIGMTHPDLRNEVREEMASGSMLHFIWNLPVRLIDNFGGQKFTQAKKTSVGDAFINSAKTQYNKLFENYKLDIKQKEKFTVAEQWRNVNAFEAVERGLTVYGNQLRFEEFVRGVERLKAEGKDEINHLEDYKLLASYIRTFSGRAKPAGFELNQKGLNLFFFSFKNAASVIQQLNPVYYMKQHVGSTDFKNGSYFKPTVANKMAMATMFKSVVSTSATMLFLMAAYNAGKDDDEEEMTVEKDPRSSDFGKLKIGTFRYDPWGGYIPLITLYARLLTEETKNSDGKVLKLGEDRNGIQNRGDAMVRFIVNKESPGFRMVHQYLASKIEENKATGEKSRQNDFGENLLESDAYSFYPIFMGSVKDAKEKDFKGVQAFLTAYSVLGLGNVQDYEKSKMSKENIEKTMQERLNPTRKTSEERRESERKKIEKERELRNKAREEGIRYVPPRR